MSYKFLGREVSGLFTIPAGIVCTEPSVLEKIANEVPQAMVAAALDKELNYLPPESVYSSVEFLTMCGVGLCGRCATSKGYRNCVDGTFFRPNRV